MDTVTMTLECVHVSTVSWEKTVPIMHVQIHVLGMENVMVLAKSVHVKNCGMVLTVPRNNVLSIANSLTANV